MTVCGIDVSKEFLDVAVGSAGKSFRVPYTAQGTRRLLDKLGDVQLAVLEATGGWERVIAHAMHDAGLVVAIVNPGQVRDFARATGQLAKTDGIDAGILALYGEKLAPRPWTPPSCEQQALEALVRRRTQLVEDRKRERNRRKLATADELESIARVCALLNAEIALVDGKIEDLVNATPDVKAKNDRFRSVPGIGAVTSAILITDLPELGQITGKQAAALVGAAPFAHDSGKFHGKRSIRGGRARLRTALYMAVLSGIRVPGRLKQFYTRLISKGKAPKVAMVACMNKLVHWITAMEREHLMWSQMEAAT